MRQTPVDDYLEEISTELPEELYGNLSDAIYETVCEFDEEVAQLKAENVKLKQELEAVGTAAYLYGRGDLKDEIAKLRELVRDLYEMAYPECPSAFEAAFANRMRELGVDE